MAIRALQTGAGRALARIEAWLDAERDRLALWMPVALGGGIAAWFALPLRAYWTAFILAGCGVALAGVGLGRERRLGRAMMVSGACLALGCALIWARAEFVRARVLTTPVTTEVVAVLQDVERRYSEERVRLLISPIDRPDLPQLVRVSAPLDESATAYRRGARATMKVRLMPPAGPPVPGAYDFARTAWFMRLGATGRTLGPAIVFEGPVDQPGLRERIANHVRTRLAGSAGGIAAAFATGDRGGIDSADEDAMRNSGLTHLLSISGLHITAVVGATMVLVLRILALSPWLALRWPLLLIAAGAGAASGIGYTLLTGAEVPTIRSCVAAVLVLVGLALGREALTLRLVAAGALLVLLVLPESLAGASFQLSFTAICAIVALHDLPVMHRLVGAREEGAIRRAARTVASLLATGIAVEIALAPIALFHFHKSGLYGALANIVAIPLTTFVVMPCEALALLFDLVGLGAPFWWVTGQGLALLLWLARSVSEAPGAVAMVPQMPQSAFALMTVGALWLMLWSTRARLLGLLPFVVGAVLAWVAPVPDVLVTGDGRHVVVRSPGRGSAILRERAGDYVRGVLAEATGEQGEAAPIDMWPGARCSRDACVFAMQSGGRAWRIAATRSRYRLDWAQLTTLCSAMDIMISERMLPRSCAPRWLTIDPNMLRRTGGIALFLTPPHLHTVRRIADDHPWVMVSNTSVAPQQPRQPPLNTHLRRVVALRFVGSVGRIKPHH